MRLMTDPAYHEGWTVIPPITIAVTLQGWYLLTSIGMNITKRTGYYPIAAGLAAAANIAANVVLIPRLGIMGTAWSNVISYAVLAGVAFVFSQRFYPIPYEYGRLLRVVVAGLAAYFAAALLLPDIPRALVGLTARGAVVLIVYPALLGAIGFFHAREVARIRALASALVSARARKAVKGPDARAEAESERMAGEAAGLDGFEEDR
jgi:O-antigen/teichoic acid export membrane protein